MSILKKEITKTRIRYYFFGIRVCSFHRDTDLNLNEIYDEDFYKQQAEDSIKSAKEIIPFIKEVIDPKSVLDVGCGAGTWLKVWSDFKVDIQGVDCNTIPEDGLYISRSKIIISDLVEENLKNKLNNVDLVESLEVAEHIDEAYANKFVDLITSKADTILFSAAIPFQGGTHHVNLQPLEYWNQKFREKGFECFDILRDKLWNNDNICYWYRQNILVFAKGDGKQKLLEKGFKISKSINTYYHPIIVKDLVGS